MTNSAKLILIIFLILAGLGAYTLLSKPGENDIEQAACTMEAKMCPDGSFVGRVPPTCEFAECPAVVVPNDWQTNTDSETGATFRYPADFGSKYISAVDWPPNIQITEPFACTEAGEADNRAGQTIQRDINNRTYCVTTITEGAAGSVYHQYAYAFERNGQMPILTFSVQMPQCANFDEEEQAVCEEEQENFDIDQVIDLMVSTFELNN
jgi:hypothetical protein